jgi:ribonuclease HII
LAGPVIAACVVSEKPLMLPGLNDSKLVPAERRFELDAMIRGCAAGYGIGEASVEEIDRLNIYRASILAMERAIAALPLVPAYLLIDAMRLSSVRIPHEAIVKGDARSATIAAASIVAKTHRDRLMIELDARFPQYGFASHKGYATARHLAALREHGPCPHHRRDFSPVANALSLFDSAGV